MTLAEQYPNEYQAWVAAGGIENNLKKHLLGIGSITPTADDLKMLARECRASVDQLVNALNAYPFA